MGVLLIVSCVWNNSSKHEFTANAPPPRKSVVSSMRFLSSLFFCSQAPKNPNSPSTNSHLLFILGVNAPRAAFSSPLSKSIGSTHFISEVDPREEITQPSRSEIGGHLFSSISKTIGSQKSVLLSSHLGPSQFLYGTKMIGGLFVLRVNG